MIFLSKIMIFLAKLLILAPQPNFFLPNIVHTTEKYEHQKERPERHCRNANAKP